MISSTLFFLFNIVLAIPILLPFDTKLRVILYISTISLAGILIGISLNLYINVRIIDILAVQGQDGEEWGKGQMETSVIPEEEEGASKTASGLGIRNDILRVEKL